ncbi:MAG: class II fructose-bisphosphate aldolase, partial [Armatimonadetes bacterium]|nr:class II fructose-bisphosphate aldolase [Armatimonadota bacterium]
ARAEAQPLQIPVAIHLDHGNSLEMVAECLDAGFTSVMLDASDRPFAENVRLTGRAAEMARQAGADSEGEIGAVGRADDISIEGPHAGTLTDPEQAAQFVAETGIDAVAISIGNAHGIYTQEPNLDFQRLRQISELVDVPLVLHGGSGTPEQDVRQAIALGIAKVNVASALGHAFGSDLAARFADPDDTLWMPLQMVKALEAVAAVVRYWLELTGAAGQARS